MNDWNRTDQDNAGEPDSIELLKFPPFIFLTSMAAGILFHIIRPMRLFRNRMPGIALSIPMIASGIGLAIWAERTMHGAGERPDFREPTRSVVSGGPFAYSRNPIYTGVATAYAGGALLLNTVWPLITLTPGLLQLHHRVIKYEEEYLEEKIGLPYRNYKQAVRRWL